MEDQANSWQLEKIDFHTGHTGTQYRYSKFVITDKSSLRILLIMETGLFLYNLTFYEKNA